MRSAGSVCRFWSATGTGITTTGQAAFRMHPSLTEPSTVCRTWLCPWLPGTSRSALWPAAARTSAGRALQRLGGDQEGRAGPDRQVVDLVVENVAGVVFGVEVLIGSATRWWPVPWAVCSAGRRGRS